MWKDEVVEEVRKIRDEYAAKFNYDIDAIYKDIKRLEAESGREFVTFPPRKPMTSRAKKLVVDKA